MDADWRDARTTGQRIRWAAEHFQAKQGKRRGVSLLTARLKDRRVRGATPPTVATYLRDEPEAPIEFVRAVAAELSPLSASWLAFGTGAPTPQHAQLGELSALHVPFGLASQEPAPAGSVNPFHDASPFELGNELRNQLLEALGLPTAPPTQPVPAWVSAIGIAWVRFVRSGSGHMTEVRGLSKRLAEAIAAPVRLMDADSAELLSRGYLTEYIVSMIPPLLRLADVQKMVLNDEVPILEAPPTPVKRGARGKQRTKKRTR